MLVLLFTALFGLAFGSFLNVCIVRLPRGESIAQPPSHCRSCGRPLRLGDNIPLLSWLLLRGRSHCCQQPISAIYPFVEAATALLFVGCIYVFGLSPTGVCFAILCWLLLGLAVMDARTYLLPDWFTLSGLVLGLGFRVALAPTARLAAAGYSIGSAAVLGGSLLTVALLYKLVRHRDGMGMGDVKLVAMLGVWLGWQLGSVALFLAILAGAAAGIVIVILSRNQPAAKDVASPGAGRLPFGTFLAAGGIVAIFEGRQLLAWYVGLL